MPDSIRNAGDPESPTDDPYAVPAHDRSELLTAADDVLPRPAAFGKAHVWVFLTLLALATVQTLFTTSRGLDPGNNKLQHVVFTTLLAICGPLTGAISRDLQPCCLAFSVSLLPYCLPPVLAAFLLQLLWRPRASASEILRVAVWGVAWAGWFAAGFVSFLHALM